MTLTYFICFCTYSRPRYQVSVYRTIGPLVLGLIWPAQLQGPTRCLGSAVAWWLMPRTPDAEVGGSSPTRVEPCCVLEQGTFTP